jgi:hypothetical protein
MHHYNMLGLAFVTGLGLSGCFGPAGVGYAESWIRVFENPLSGHLGE